MLMGHMGRHYRILYNFFFVCLIVFKRLIYILTASRKDKLSVIRDMACVLKGWMGAHSGTEGGL
jgi:hypothetical protein